MSIKDNDMAKQNAEKAWELDSDDDGKKEGMGGEWSFDFFVKEKNQILI